jgi:hypothetical protein
MKKTILGAPGITGDSPELPLPAILIIKNGKKKSKVPTKKGHQAKEMSRSRRNLPGGK